VPVDFPGADPRHPSTTYGPRQPDDFQAVTFHAYGQLAVASIVSPRGHGSACDNFNLNPDSDNSYDSDTAWRKCSERDTQHTGLALWSPSPHGWHKQAQIVTTGPLCFDHQPVTMPVLRLFLSPDGCILAAENNCRRIHAWSWHLPPSDSLANVEEP